MSAKLPCHKHGAEDRTSLFTHFATNLLPEPAFGQSQEREVQSLQCTGLIMYTATGQICQRNNPVCGALIKGKLYR